VGFHGRVTQLFRGLAAIFRSRKMRARTRDPGAVRAGNGAAKQGWRRRAFPAAPPAERV